ncbi:LCP family protein [Patescibacteria group bacterium]|nr:LCP family protein [Patescibacteria group bacterium]MBU0777119.1 LCP family protein [Patescibacteria group bacterium]MBU0845813.1 LCP family protein [Patescibacteria group bacterium]MBU0922840.1 LCP family protein [Patescibacteria group bacterium]MBU1066427.1 LCP family protein [Patescibacteria group bacterium]
MFLKKLKERVLHLDRRIVKLTASLFTLFFVGIGLSYLYFTLSRPYVAGDKTVNITEAMPATPVVDSPDTFNVLLLGYGGAGHDGGNLTDSITLASVDTKEKEVVLISIPRDLWIALPVDYDNTQNYKINAAYAIGGDENKYPNKKPVYRGEEGGGELAKYAASIVTGLEVDYYMSINFDGLVDAIDLLGGIEVDVSNPFDDYFYPVKGLENETCGISGEDIAEFHQKYSGFQLEKQFECRYEHLHFEKGLQKIDGETALKFVRSRHSDQYGGDFARSARQHEILAAIKNKLISLDAISQASPVLNKLTGSVNTDLDSEAIKQILTKAGNPLDYKIAHIYLTEDNVFYSSSSSGGQYILIPREGVNKWSEVHKYISGDASD